MKYIIVTSQWTLRDVQEDLLVMKDGLSYSFFFRLNGEKVGKRQESACTMPVASLVLR